MGIIQFVFICGQCASICPFDSINERSEIDEVKAAIADPNKIVVFQTAPAVRVEALGGRVRS